MSQSPPAEYAALARNTVAPFFSPFQVFFFFFFEGACLVIGNDNEHWVLIGFHVVNVDSSPPSKISVSFI